MAEKTGWMWKRLFKRVTGYVPGLIEKERGKPSKDIIKVKFVLKKLKK